MPNNLLYFERLMLLSIALGVITAVVGVRPYENDFERNAEFSILLVQALVLGFIACITFLVTRMQSKIAKWAWIFVFFIGLVIYVPYFNEMKEHLTGLMLIGQFFLQIVATCLLLFYKRA